MCEREEVREEINNALKQNNKNFDIHFGYIKQSLIDNKEDCKALTETISRHIEKIDNSYCTKTELNVAKDDNKKNEKRIGKLESRILAIITTSVLAIISGLGTIIWFFINNFVIK